MHIIEAVISHLILSVICYLLYNILYVIGVFQKAPNLFNLFQSAIFYFSFSFQWLLHSHITWYTYLIVIYLKFIALHPFLFILLILVSVVVWLEPIPSVMRQKVSYVLDMSSELKDRQPFTPTAILQSPVNVICLSLHHRRKQENLERGHTGTGRTCKFHRTLKFHFNFVYMVWICQCLKCKYPSTLESKPQQLDCSKSPSTW